MGMVLWFRSAGTQVPSQNGRINALELAGRQRVVPTPPNPFLGIWLQPEIPVSENAVSRELACSCGISRVDFAQGHLSMTGKSLPLTRALTYPDVRPSRMVQLEKSGFRKVAKLDS